MMSNGIISGNTNNPKKKATIKPCYLWFSNKGSQTASSSCSSFLYMKKQRKSGPQKISAHTGQTQKLVSTAADKEINYCSVNAKRTSSSITFITQLLLYIYIYIYICK